MKLKSLFILLLGLSLIFTGCKTETNTEEEEFTVDATVLAANLVYMIMGLDKGEFVIPNEYEVTERFVVENKTLYRIHFRAHDDICRTGGLSNIFVTPYSIPDDIYINEWDLERPQETYSLILNEDNLWSEKQLRVLRTRLDLSFTNLRSINSYSHELFQIPQYDLNHTAVVVPFVLAPSESSL